VILSEYCRYLEGIPHEELSDNELFGNIKSGDDTVLEKFLPADFIPRKEYLRQLSVYEQVEQLIDIFKLKERRSEIPYLMGFQDAINGLFAEGRGRHWSVPRILAGALRQFFCKQQRKSGCDTDNDHS
jgi:hypothetical protein